MPCCGCELFLLSSASSDEHASLFERTPTCSPCASSGAALGVCAWLVSEQLSLLSSHFVPDHTGHVLCIERSSVSGTGTLQWEESSWWKGR